jgi:hypothetical protein
MTVDRFGETQHMFATHYYLAGKVPISNQKSKIGKLSRNSSYTSLDTSK